MDKKLTDEQQFINYMADNWTDPDSQKEDFLWVVTEFKDYLKAKKEEAKDEIRPDYYKKGDIEVFDLLEIIAKEAEDFGLARINTHYLLTALTYLLRMPKGEFFNDVTKAITYLKKIKKSDDYKGLDYIKIPEGMPINENTEVTFDNTEFALPPIEFRNKVESLVLKYLVKYQHIPVVNTPEDIANYIKIELNDPHFSYKMILSEIIPAVCELMDKDEDIEIVNHRLCYGFQKIEIKYKSKNSLGLGDK